MRLVLDASVVLPFVAQTTSEGQALRSWLVDQLDGDSAHIIHTLTQVEVLSALRKLEADGDIEEAWADHVQRRINSWPFTVELITARRRERAWELRSRLTIPAATYVATTESLQAEHRQDVAFCTADRFLLDARLPCTVIAVPGLA